MKKSLILSRHAQSRNVEHGKKDIDRDLSDSGIQEASRLGRYLYVNEIIPKVILTSNARRALDTAQLIAEQLKMDKSEIIVNEDLYEASVRLLLGLIAQLEEEKDFVLIIGHNPAITHICEYISDEVIGFLPPGSMVHLEFNNLKWSDVSKGLGNLVEIKYPDQISFTE